MESNSQYPVRNGVSTDDSGKHKQPQTRTPSDSDWPRSYGEQMRPVSEVVVKFFRVEKTNKAISIGYKESKKNEIAADIRDHTAKISIFNTQIEYFAAKIKELKNHLDQKTAEVRDWLSDNKRYYLRSENEQIADLAHCLEGEVKEHFAKKETTAASEITKNAEKSNAPAPWIHLNWVYILVGLVVTEAVFSYLTTLKILHEASLWHPTAFAASAVAILMVCLLKTSSDKVSLSSRNNLVKNVTLAGVSIFTLLIFITRIFAIKYSEDPIKSDLIEKCMEMGSVIASVLVVPFAIVWIDDYIKSKKETAMNTLKPIDEVSNADSLEVKDSYNNVKERFFNRWNYFLTDIEAIKREIATCKIDANSQQNEKSKEELLVTEQQSNLTALNHEIDSIKNEQSQLAGKEMLMSRIVEILSDNTETPDLSALDEDVRLSPSLNLDLLRVLDGYIAGLPRFPAHERTTEDYEGQARKLIRYLDHKGTVSLSLINKLSEEITTH